MNDKLPQGRVVILTALRVEYMAVRAHLSNVREAIHKGSVYELGTFTGEHCSWQVGIAEIGAGNTGAAFAAERAIAYFQPQVIFFVGVAGGIKDVTIGDVVVATKVYGYESGKLKDDMVLIRSDVGESSFTLVQRAQAEGRQNDWLQRTQHCDRSLNPNPQVYTGAIAAGEKVVADSRSDLYQFLYRYYNDTLAVEMEGRGLLQAARANEPVQALIIRGISDLIENKSEADKRGSQALASCYASAFAFEILARLVPNGFSGAYIGTETPLPRQVSTTLNKIQRSNTATVVLPPHIPDEPYYHLPSREHNLHQLLSVLQDPQGAPALVIDGLGGMGKTALAIELVRRTLHEQFFEGIVGDSAKLEQFSGGEVIRVSEAQLDFNLLLDAIARQLDHWEVPSRKLEEKQVLLSRLLRQHRYLLMIDNLEDVDNAQELVAKLRNLLGTSRALITSRQKVRHDFVYSLSLQGLDVEDALFFMRKGLEQRGGHQLQSAPREKLTAIWQITGGAPLAMKLVIAQAMTLDIDVVLEQLQQAIGNIYPFIFRTSWKQLTPAARKILIYIGRTVVTTASWRELKYLNITDEKSLIAAIDQLTAYSLLDVSSLSGQLRYGVHQLTRQFVTSELPTMWHEQGLQ